MAEAAEQTGPEVKAVAKFVRISASKARRFVDLVRGKDVEAAISLLRFAPGEGARLVSKVVNSAAANAERNHHIARSRLFVSSAFVDQGPTLKRFRPRAMGRATRIRKRTSHITVAVKEKES